MADHNQPQEVPEPEVHSVSFKVSGTALLADQGQLAHQAKVDEIQSAVQGVTGLLSAEVSDFKLHSPKETRKEAEKAEKAEAKEAAAEKKAEAKKA